jgi:hypothetical protein
VIACDRRDALLIESENAETQFASLLQPLHPSAQKHTRQNAARKVSGQTQKWIP